MYVIVSTVSGEVVFEGSPSVLGVRVTQPATSEVYVIVSTGGGGAPPPSWGHSDPRSSAVHVEHMATQAQRCSDRGEQ